MDRRYFLRVMACAPALVAALPLTSKADAQRGLIYHRFNFERLRYERVQKMDIKAGDCIWIEGELDAPDNSPWHVYLCCEDAEVQLYAVTFAVSHWMGKNGEWVPYRKDDGEWANLAPAERPEQMAV